MGQVYTASGVDVVAGDDYSSFAAKVCRDSLGNSRYVVVEDLGNGHFRGPRGFYLKGLPPGHYLDLAPDGIGTKTVIIDAAANYFYAAPNLLEMCTVDIARWGGMALLFTNVLEVGSLGKTGEKSNTDLRQLMFGMGDAAKHSSVVLYKGETAESGVCVGTPIDTTLGASPTRFNWSGVALGVYDHDRLITGRDLAAGQSVIALREHSPRSNGYSAIRRGLQIKYGEEWYKQERSPELEKHLQQAAMPSTIYHRFLTELNGWNDQPRVPITMIAHITGGGIKSKFAEDMLFPQGLSANLHDLWQPPDIMREVAFWTQMKNEEAYETFNGGQGVLMTCEPRHEDEVIRRAEGYSIHAKVCGRIEQHNEPRVRIRSMFNNKGGDVVYWAA